MSADGSIGIFDSGVGGLAVLREIARTLPHENLIYVADSKYAPYGDKPVAYIERRSSAIAELLIQRGGKAIVVACNTATAVAVDALRARWDVPIVAMEPAIKPAVAMTKSKVIGVLATEQTLASARFVRLVEKYGAGVEILAQPCPGLAEQVENGDLEGVETRALVTRYVEAVREKGADTIVLGCTHYGFLTPLIRSSAGPDARIVDPSVPVAHELRRRLERFNLLTTRTGPGTIELWSTGAPDLLESRLRQFGMDAHDARRLDV